MSTNTDATATIGRVAPRYLNRQQAIALGSSQAAFDMLLLRRTVPDAR